jgi:hypothetical protein
MFALSSVESAVRFFTSPEEGVPAGAAVPVVHRFRTIVGLEMSPPKKPATSIKTISHKVQTAFTPFAAE